MGQFFAHDVTFDIGSSMGTPMHPERVTNARTSAFDLDTVYGQGPVGSPALYDSADCRGTVAAVPSSPTRATTFAGVDPISRGQ